MNGEPPPTADPVLPLIQAALAHHQAGRRAEAEALYRRARALAPAHADLCCLYATLLLQSGRLDQGVAELRAALALQPDHAVARFNLATALKQQGALDEAIGHYRQLLRLRPNDPDTHINLGNALASQGLSDDALACYRSALALNPEQPLAHYNLGQALQRRGQRAEAIRHYQAALRARPDHADALNQLGTALAEDGAFDQALACYARALQLKPRHHQALANRGTALKELGQLEAAAASYRAALALRADEPELLVNLAHTLKDLGQAENALSLYQRALSLQPDHGAARSHLIALRRRVCDWSTFAEDEAWLLQAIEQRRPEVPPFLTLAAGTTLAQQRTCAETHAALRCRGIEPLAGDGVGEAIPPPPPCGGGPGWGSRPVPGTDSSAIDRTTPTLTLPRRAGEGSPGSVDGGGNGGKIRLGYLSADFHTHATAYLTAELFERHDRQRFEVCGYSYGPDDGSALRRRLVAGFDHFVDLRRLSHQAAAERIRQDGIELLVDLKGFTQFARPEILAYRPAPLQLSYLGYPGTLGSPTLVDTVIADPVVAPLADQPWYAERIVHLPHCYQCNDRQRAIAPETPSRQECGLPDDALVLCCFNSPHKLTPAWFQLWLSLLQALPQAVLWLLEGPGPTAANLRREAARQGIAPERLVLAPMVPLAQHLARHRLADLFLDTLPYNAHTTASDALWAGLPVLTCRGETFAGRVGASLLQAVGLPELITTSPADYQALALALARAPDRLAALRDRLARQRLTTPLFDSERFNRALEALYLELWQRGPAPWPAVPAP